MGPFYIYSAPKLVRFFGLSSEFGPFAQIYPIFGLKFIKKVRFCPIFGSQSQLRLPQQPQSASEAGNVSWIRLHVGQYMCRVLLRVDHHLSIASIACLWIRSVRSGSPWSISCKCTYGDIRRRNPSSVDSVEDCTQPDRTSGFTTGYTQERNHLSVICVENGLKSSSSSGFTRQLILGREIFYSL